MDQDRSELMGFIEGRAQSAQALITRHSAPLVNFATYQLSGDRDMAQDLVQECFMRLWRNAKKLIENDKPLELRAWLFRVLRNLILDEQRKPRFAPSSEMPETEDGSLSASDRIDHQERAKTAMDLIGRLPERQKSALLMAHFEDMRNPEIANALECSVEAVENLLARARRSLRAWAETPEGKEVAHG